MSAKVSLFFRAHGQDGKAAVVKPTLRREDVFEDGSRTYAGRAEFTLPAGRSYTMTASLRLPPSASAVEVEFVDGEDSAALPAGAKLPGLLISVNGHVSPVKTSKTGLRNGDIALRTWSGKGIVYGQVYRVSGALIEKTGTRTITVNLPEIGEAVESAAPVPVLSDNGAKVTA